MSDARTIFALSSGALPSGIAVVRVSGPDAFAALVAVAGMVPEPRVATLRTLRDGADIIDRALVLAFPGPASATGEDVAEFHVHGGQAVVAALLSCMARQPGLRPATAGEYTRRAFDNGRLDLTQAEGLADLVTAETEAQRRAALTQSDGALRRRVEGWRATIIGLLAEAEAGLDFAEGEEDVETGLHRRNMSTLADLIADLEASLRDSARARALREGLTIVVSGPPNVGKSSLVNALSRREVAIVSPWPGTTRDALEARLDLGGVLVTLVDTAGLRDTDDPIEAEGVARARARAADADLVLNLWTDGAPPAGGLAVRTKIDLGGAPCDGLAVSSLTGTGIATLTDHLASWARATVRPEEPPLLAHERHYTACSAALEALWEAAATQDDVLEAESLRSAASALGTITGAVGVEEVFDRIFSQFCIGK
ncbi:tRNA uridine-5-carboxymethylaminomethyl(34) synthesis GTPase MnmE [Sphingosinicellaceae bacterium]|nr:tRNA uridine-5-carboxymethylaminomethyl(34) synthesis GTPase MnmE [Sphingosinicellaceae bacterium]